MTLPTSTSVPTHAAPLRDCGVVTVFECGFAHAAAVCSCGWTGRRRYRLAAANLDAWEHSIRERCVIAEPLVLHITALAGVA